LAASGEARRGESSLSECVELAAVLIVGAPAGEAPSELLLLLL
jgi:hypothetical protein